METEDAALIQITGVGQREDDVVHQENRELGGVNSPGGERGQQRAAQDGIEGVAVDDAKRSAAAKQRRWNGNRVGYVDVQADGRKHHWIDQRVVAGAADELPEVGALKGVNVLGVSYIRRTEHEVVVLKDRGLLEERLGDIIGRAEASRVGRGRIKSGGSLHRCQNSVLVQF